MDAIQKDFGDFKSFKQQLTTATVAIQGSGWGWLVSFIPVGSLLRAGLAHSPSTNMARAQFPDPSSYVD